MHPVTRQKGKHGQKRHFFPRSVRRETFVTRGRRGEHERGEHLIQGKHWNAAMQRCTSMCKKAGKESPGLTRRASERGRLRSLRCDGVRRSAEKFGVILSQLLPLKWEERGGRQRADPAFSFSS